MKNKKKAELGHLRYQVSGLNAENARLQDALSVARAATDDATLKIKMVNGNVATMRELVAEMEAQRDTWMRRAYIAVGYLSVATKKDAHELLDEISSKEQESYE
jgi:hypothetical protein